MPIETSMYSVPKLDPPDIIGMYNTASAAKVRLEQAQKLAQDRAAEEALGKVMQGAVDAKGQFDFGRATQAVLNNPLTAAKAPEYALEMLKAKGMNADLATKSLVQAATRQEMLGKIASGVLQRGTAGPDGTLGLDDKAVAQGLGDLSKQFPELRGQLGNMVKRLAVMSPSERYAMVHQTALGALSGKEALDSLNSHIQTKVMPDGTLIGVDTRRGTASVLAKAEPKPQIVSEGGALVSPEGKELYRAPSRPMVVGSDSALVRPDSGSVLFSNKPMNEVTDPSSPLALPKSTMRTEGVNYPGATGLGGAAKGAANTVLGTVGGVAFPEEERATQSLTNLGLRTKTLLLDAVPGRPSNFLLQQLDKFEVTPNSLTMGSGRATERLAQTKDMIEAEVRRIDQDVLSRPGDFTKTQLSAARQSRSKLLGLLSDYETVIKEFPRGNDPLAGVARRAVRAVRSNASKVEKKLDAAASGDAASGTEKWERGPDGKPRRVE